MHRSEKSAGSNVKGGFCTTHWTAIFQTYGRDPEEAARALGELCQAYWSPICAFVQSRGYDRHSAEDRTQEFLSGLLASNSLAALTPEKGRFRSFLLACLKHFLANEWRRSQTQKRGGDQQVVSLDSDDLNGHNANLSTKKAEQEFDRQWAETLLHQVLSTLERELQMGGQSARFDALKIYLLDDGSRFPYAQAAAALGISEPAAKSAIYRLRRRYAELFREEISKTVATPDEVEEEIRYLFSIVSQ